MQIQVSSGRCHVPFKIDNNNVTFFPNGTWEFHGSKELTGNSEADFVIKGRTKQDAQVIDFEQQHVHCVVSNKVKKEVICQRYTRFWSDEKRTGVPMHIPPRKFSRQKPVLSKQDIFRQELENANSALRQCRVMASQIAEEGYAGSEVFGTAHEKLESLIKAARDITKIVYPRPKLHYLASDDSRQRTNGSMCGVIFSHDIRPTEQEFMLCRIDSGNYYPLYKLTLRRDGQWTTPQFVGVNGLSYSRVSHETFATAIMWLVNFAEQDDGSILADQRLSMLKRADPRLAVFSDGDEMLSK